MTITIIPCRFFPPEGRAWYTAHWSLGWTPERVEAELKKRGLTPAVVYQDAGGTYWVPLASHNEKRNESAKET